MREITQTIGFSEDDSEHIILAVDEACSNIIKHSYMNDSQKKIDFCIETQENELKIQIKDYGKQCDIRQMKPRALTDIRPGGLGVYIMNQVMDSVKYDCSSAKQNQIIMTKRMDPLKETTRG